MTSERLLRRLGVAVGVLLLADSASQLVIAVASWDPGSLSWRVGNLRLLFTQVTPLLLAWMLLLISAVESSRGRRLAAVLSWLLALLVIGLGLRLRVDAASMGAVLKGGQHDLHQRATLQALVSAFALALGLMLTGWLEFRGARRSPSASARRSAPATA